jgi:DNA invertase Pin-like site-specific DNA recombinase
VSTEKQEHGPEAQRAAIEAFAGREGVRIVQWFSEEESGASEIVDRPELQAALEAVRTHRAGVFLAAKRDRLAREVTIAREIGERARGFGGVVITADGMSDVEKRPDTFLKQGISDLFAEHERHQIADRTTLGLQVMRRKGFRTGEVPYGFQAAREGPLSKTSGRPLPLEPNAAEQAVCAYVMRLHEQGWSARRIERDLRDRKIVSRAGRPLAKVQVQRIIKRCEALREVFPEHAGGSFAAVAASATRAIPVTDPELDAPDGAVVDGMQRVGDMWHPIATPVESSRENSAVATYEEPKATSTTVLACARGHVFDDASREGCYCTRNECAAERGTFKPERRIEWRTR